LPSIARSLLLGLDELEDFCEDYPDGRFYAAIFAEYPLQTQLKVVPLLKSRLDKSEDADRRRRQTEVLKVKFRRRMRDLRYTLLDRNERRRKWCAENLK
jgi:hypothetical protein